MLLKVTNKCSMGCAHCSEDSLPTSPHMTEETFLQALELTERVERVAWSVGCPPLILLSGGECTEHPDIVKMIETVYARGLVPLLISNGMWLGDKDLRESILRPEWPKLMVQVTNDSRFYPKAPPRVDDPRVMYVDALTILIPLGRAARKNFDAKGLPRRKGPSSFNLRSLTRSYGKIEDAVAHLRIRATNGMSGQCTPAIGENGDVMAGETRSCFKIGTVASSTKELTRALIKMQCNKCGLEDDLTQEQKRAIGSSMLYLGSER